MVSLVSIGTLVVAANSQGWFRFIKDEINTIETMVAPANPVGTLPASNSEKTITAVHLDETIVPSQTPTITSTGTSTPTPTPTVTITPTYTPASTFTSTPAPDNNPVPGPNIIPTDIPNDHQDNGNHYGQNSPSSQTQPPPRLHPEGV